MALSNFSKSKIYGLLNGTATGASPTTYIAFFNASNVEVLPYATRPQVNFTYDLASSELRNAAINMGNATSSVGPVTAVKVFDAASGGNELFTLTAPSSFSFTSGEEASFNAAVLVLDLEVAGQASDITPAVMSRYGDWVAGTPHNGFTGVVVALFNGATEVTGAQLGARQPITFNTTTGANTAELNFGAASSAVTFDTAKVMDGTDLLTGATLTPATVSVTQGSTTKIAAGGLTISITS
jgi:hypothetical protein